MRTPEQVAQIEAMRAGAEMGRLASHILQSGESGPAVALQMAIARKSSERIQMVLRDAVSAGTTASQSSIVPMAPISNAFLALLRGYSFFDTFAQDAIKMPLNTRAVVGAGGSIGGILGEGAPAPLIAFSYSAPPLSPIKAQAIVVLSNELVRAGGGPLESAINRQLRDAIAKTVNEHFLTAIVPYGSPSPDVISLGTTAKGVLQDIGLLLAAIDTDAFSRVHLAMSPALCKVLTTLPTAEDGNKAFPGMSLNGGEIAGLPVTACNEVAADEVVAVDATKFAVNLGEVLIDRSEETSLEFESEPTASPGASTVYKSLWQQNLAALKANRTFAFTQLNANAVAKLVDVEWGATS